MSESWLPILQKGIFRFIRLAGVRSAVLVSTLLAVTVLAGCSGDTKKWRVVLSPTNQLNQDDAGASLPVLVRVYQLRAKDKFQQATFKTLWKADKEFLEGDLLERKEITIHPDTQAVVDIDLDVKHGAAYFGIMALFRKPEVEGWKQVVAADSSAFNPFTPKVKLILDKNVIKLAD